MIARVIADHPAKMLLVQRGNMIENLAATTAASFGRSVLPWRLAPGALRL